jgi:hypothetical protein
MPSIPASIRQLSWRPKFTGAWLGTLALSSVPVTVFSPTLRCFAAFGEPRVVGDGRDALFACILALELLLVVGLSAWGAEAFKKDLEQLVRRCGGPRSAF